LSRIAHIKLVAGSVHVDAAFAFLGLGFGFVTLSCAAIGRQQAASRHSRNESSFETVVLYRNFFLTSKTPSLCAVIRPTPPPTAS
jgi:hypothetical protein